MLESLSRNWWLVALGGVLAVILGAAAFVWPGMTLLTLVLLFGAYAFVGGVTSFGFGLLAAGEHGEWWPLVLGGIIGIAVGVVTFMQPTTMALALVFVIAAWAIATGLLEVVAAITLRKVIANEWLMGFSGVLSVIFGVAVVAQPATGALALVYLFGFYAILYGVSQIGLGFRLRGLGEALKPGTQGAASVAG